MRLISTSVKSSVVFYLTVFAVQVALFFLIPPYYVASPNQTQIPAFIKWSFIKYFGLVVLFYLGWATLWGILNGLAFKWSRISVKKIRGLWPLFLAWTCAQFFLLLFLITYAYPTVLNQFPPLDRIPLGASYLFFIATGAACLFWAFRIVESFTWRQWGGWITSLLLPLGLMLFLMRPSELRLAPVTPSSKRPHILMLGFDALDGDTGTAVLSVALQGRGARIYSNAFTPLPLTHPAWNSILSGFYPDKHKVRFFFGSPQPPLYPELYLPLRLKNEAGYRTLFASDQPETSFFTAEQGFDRSVLATIGWRAHLVAMLMNHFILPAVWLNNPWTERLWGQTLNTPSVFNYDLPRFFNEAFRRFSEFGDTPALLALHTCFLHTPIRLTHREISSLPNYLRLSPREFSFWKWPLPGEEKTQTPASWVNPYFVRREGAVRFLEELIGELRRQSYLDTSIVAFFSDHGERFSKNYEIYGGIHGVDLQTRAQNNVMLAITDPRFKDTRTELQWVSLVDLTPTLLNLLEMNSPAHRYDGLALLEPSGKSRELPQRPILAESMGFIDDHSTQDKFPQLSIQSLEESLIYHPDGSVIVGPSYYQRILQKKEFADLTRMPEMRRKDNAALGQK